MSKNNKAIFGIYRSRNAAESGVRELKINGFSMEDISVLLPQESGSQEVGYVKGSKAPEGATVGAGTGAVIGGVLGLLAGVGTLMIPGVGPLLAAGPLMASLAGVGVGGVVGVVGGALIGLGIPEYQAERYEGFVKEGGILLSVHLEHPELAEKAKAALENTGAKDVSMTTELKSDWDDFRKPSMPAELDIKNVTNNIL